MAVTETATIPVERTGEVSISKPVPLLVCLAATYGSTSAEGLAPLLGVLREALAGTASHVGQVTIAYPAASAEAAAAEQDEFVLQPYSEGAAPQSITVHTAAVWSHLHDLMHAHGSTAGLLLGPEAETVSAGALGGLIDAVVERGADLALPEYKLPAGQGLLNQALLAPLTRALFAAKINFPLALDAAFSSRMAERMATVARRAVEAGQEDTIVWPVNEAAIAGYDLAEVGSTTRVLPPVTQELSQILRDVAGSLFSDIEAKSTFWQRTRPQKETLRLNIAGAASQSGTLPDDSEIDDLIGSFRIGYANLHDIWSLVLPPQTLVSLKRLSQSTRESFTVPDAIWVRIVYDFVLAYRLRTLSRGHLMGAFTPLYLAWVASHLLALHKGTAGESGALGRAFEVDRPYLVSRWRWPDRFNP